MAESFFAFFMLGIALFLLYDILRLWRILVGSAVLSFIADILWWATAAFACFSLLLGYFDGAVRVIPIIICGVGFALGYFTLGRVTKPIWVKITKPVRRLFLSVKKKLQKFNKKVKKVLQSPFNILYNKLYIHRKPFRRKGVKKQDGSYSKSKEV